jgi:hypothetical protein
MAEGKAIPYGAYEIGEDRAVVNVGVTHDTAEFAVESIRRWWKLAGRKRKQAAKRIPICADADGQLGGVVSPGKSAFLAARQMLCGLVAHRRRSILSPAHASFLVQCKRVTRLRRG